MVGSGGCVINIARVVGLGGGDGGWWFGRVDSRELVMHAVAIRSTQGATMRVLQHPPSSQALQAGRHSSHPTQATQACQAKADTGPPWDRIDSKRLGFKVGGTFTFPINERPPCGPLVPLPYSLPCACAFVVCDTRGRTIVTVVHPGTFASDPVLLGVKPNESNLPPLWPAPLPLGPIGSSAGRDPCRTRKWPQTLPAALHQAPTSRLLSDLNPTPQRPRSRHLHPLVQVSALADSPHFAASTTPSMQLDSDSYDVIVLGTGLAESIAAA